MKHTETTLHAGIMQRAAMILVMICSPVAPATAQTVLGELTTAGGAGDYQYGPVPGTFVVDLTDVPTGALVIKFVKIANDIAALGGPAGEMPEFEVKLERDPTNTGVFTEDVVIVALTAVSHGLASNFYSLKLTPDPAANGDFAAEPIYTIRIIMPTGGWAAAQANPAQERLRIGVKNNHATDDRTYLGVLGDTAPEAEVGWITTQPETVEFGELQRGLPESDVGDQLLTIANVGTGPLTVNSLSDLSATAFDRGPTTIDTVLQPQGTLTTEISFNPSHTSITDFGPVTTNLTVTNDSANDTTLDVPLQATVVQLEIAFLYDVSGSMGFRPEDLVYTDPPPDKEDTRLYQAQLAGLELLLIMKDFEGESIRAGLFTFPRAGVTGNTPSAAIVVGMNPLTFTFDDLGDRFDASHADSLVAPKFGMTPMAEGILKAHGFPLADHWGRQHPFVRRALILLSDGKHNVNSAGALPTPNSWVTYFKTLQTPPVRMFTIGYGHEGITTVDHVTLRELGDETGGGFYNADSLGTAPINKTFRAAMIDWLALEVLTDPEDTLTKGQPKPDEHTVCVDDSLSTVAFVVNWNKIATDAINFTLNGPNGTVSTMSPDVSFHSLQNSKTFVVKGETLQPGAWTFVLTGGSGLSSGESVDYTYSSFGKSKVTLSAQQVRPWVINVGPFLELALFSPRPLPFVGDTIRVEYDVPGESYTKWLSSMEGIRVEWLVAPDFDTTVGDPTAAAPGGRIADDPWTVNKVDLGREATLMDRKIYALNKFAKRPFRGTRKTGELTMRDDGRNGDRVAGDGVYTVKMDAFPADGLAHIRAILDWGGDDDCLQREVLLDRYVGIALDKAALFRQVRFVDVEISPLFPALLRTKLAQPVPPGFVREMAVARPMAGTVPFGPGRPERLTFDFTDATPIESHVDLANGDYVQVFQYQIGASPVVVLTVDGVTTDTIRVTRAGGLPAWAWVLIILGILLLVILIIRLIKK